MTPPLLLVSPPRTLGNLRLCMRQLEAGRSIKTPRGKTLWRQVASAMRDCERIEPDIDLERPESVQGKALKGMVTRLARCLEMEISYGFELETFHDLHFERYQSLYLDNRLHDSATMGLWDVVFRCRQREAVPNWDSCRRRLATAVAITLDTDGYGTDLLRTLSYLLGENGDDDEVTATLDTLVLCGGLDPFSKVHDNLQTFILDGTSDLVERLDLDTVTRDLVMVEERLAPKYSYCTAEVRQAVESVLRTRWPDFE